MPGRGGCVLPETLLTFNPSDCAPVMSGRKAAEKGLLSLKLYSGLAKSKSWWDFFPRKLSQRNTVFLSRSFSTWPASLTHHLALPRVHGFSSRKGFGGRPLSLHCALEPAAAAADEVPFPEIAEHHASQKTPLSSHSNHHACWCVLMCEHVHVIASNTSTRTQAWHLRMFFGGMGPMIAEWPQQLLRWQP